MIRFFTEALHREYMSDPSKPISLLFVHAVKVYNRSSALGVLNLGKFPLFVPFRLIIR